MPDFFTRLAERALGLGPLVRPWIAPRYAEDTRPFGLEPEGPSLPLPQRLEEKERAFEREREAARKAERARPAEPEALKPERSFAEDELPLPARLRPDRPRGAEAPRPGAPEEKAQASELEQKSTSLDSENRSPSESHGENEGLPSLDRRADGSATSPSKTKAHRGEEGSERLGEGHPAQPAQGPRAAAADEGSRDVGAELASARETRPPRAAARSAPTRGSADSSPIQRSHTAQSEQGPRETQGAHEGDVREKAGTTVPPEVAARPSPPTALPSGEEGQDVPQPTIQSTSTLGKQSSAAAPSPETAHPRDEGRERTDLDTGGPATSPSLTRTHRGNEGLPSLDLGTNSSANSPLATKTHRGEEDRERLGEVHPVRPAQGPSVAPDEGPRDVGTELASARETRPPRAEASAESSLPVQRATAGNEGQNRETAQSPFERDGKGPGERPASAAKPSGPAPLQWGEGRDAAPQPTIGPTRSANLEGKNSDVSPASAHRGDEGLERLDLGSAGPATPPSLTKTHRREEEGERPGEWHPARPAQGSSELPPTGRDQLPPSEAMKRVVPTAPHEDSHAVGAELASAREPRPPRAEASSAPTRESADSSLPIQRAHLAEFEVGPQEAQTISATRSADLKTEVPAVSPASAQSGGEGLERTDLGSAGPVTSPSLTKAHRGEEDRERTDLSTVPPATPPSLTEAHRGDEDLPPLDLGTDGSAASPSAKKTHRGEEDRERPVKEHPARLTLGSNERPPNLPDPIPPRQEHPHAVGTELASAREPRPPRAEARSAPTRDAADSSLPIQRAATIDAAEGLGRAQGASEGSSFGPETAVQAEAADLPSSPAPLPRGEGRQAVSRPTNPATRSVNPGETPSSTQAHRNGEDREHTVLGSADLATLPSLTAAHRGDEGHERTDLGTTGPATSPSLTRAHRRDEGLPPLDLATDDPVTSSSTAIAHRGEERLGEGQPTPPSRDSSDVPPAVRAQVPPKESAERVAASPQQGSRAVGSEPEGRPPRPEASSAPTRESANPSLPIQRTSTDADESSPTAGSFRENRSTGPIERTPETELTAQPSRSAPLQRDEERQAASWPTIPATPKANLDTEGSAASPTQAHRGDEGRERTDLDTVRSAIPTSQTRTRGGDVGQPPSDLGTNGSATSPSATRTHRGDEGRPPFDLGTDGSATSPSTTKAHRGEEDRHRVGEGRPSRPAQHSSELPPAHRAQLSSDSTERVVPAPQEGSHTVGAELASAQEPRTPRAEASSVPTWEAADSATQSRARQESAPTILRPTTRETTDSTIPIQPTRVGGPATDADLTHSEILQEPLDTKADQKIPKASAQGRRAGESADQVPSSLPETPIAARSERDERAFPIPPLRRSKESHTTPLEPSVRPAQSADLGAADSAAPPSLTSHGRDAGHQRPGLEPTAPATPRSNNLSPAPQPNPHAQQAAESPAGATARRGAIPWPERPAHASSPELSPPAARAPIQRFSAEPAPPASLELTGALPVPPPSVEVTTAATEPASPARQASNLEEPPSSVLPHKGGGRKAPLIAEVDGPTDLESEALRPILPQAEEKIAALAPPPRRSTSPQEAPLESPPARHRSFEPERADAEGEQRQARPATVRISIGRVEIRVTETVKPPKPAPRRPSVPSLADYLAERRGRR